MIYKKTSTIWCRSFFRSNILHKSLQVLLFHVFLSGFPYLRADDRILVGELLNWDVKLAHDSLIIKPDLNPPKSGIFHSEVDHQDRLDHPQLRKTPKESGGEALANESSFHWDQGWRWQN